MDGLEVHDSSRLPRLHNMKLDKNDRFKSGADSAKKSTPLNVAVVSKRMRFTTRDYDNDVWPKNCANQNIGENGGFLHKLLSNQHGPC